MTRKLKGRGDRFLLCPSFFLDWDGSPAMGSQVKHIAQYCGACSSEEQIASKSTRALESQQARMVEVTSAGLSLGCRGDKIQLLKATWFDTCSVLRDMYYCGREVKDSRPLLLLPELYGTRLRP